VNSIKIIYAMRLSASVLLTIVERVTDGKRDAVLFATPCVYMLLPKNINNYEQTLLFPDDGDLSRDGIEITVEVEEELLNRTKILCADIGITVEQLVSAFIRFCVNADNQIALKEFFSHFNIMTALSEVKDELKCLQSEIAETKKHFRLNKQKEVK